MKPKIVAMIMPDDPVVLEAIEAMKRYHQAREAGQPEAEIERLRQAAELQFEAINEYQLTALGHQPLVRH